MAQYIGLVLALAACSAVEIKEMVVPSVVEVGSENVVLDCNYNFEASEAEQLEVKWYFNEDPAPFFQWIAGVEGSQPQLIGSLFEDKIDLTFLASGDPHTRHRALLLHQPTIEMAGTYHCKVSTLTSEAVAEANMLVYSPVLESTFLQRRLPGSKVNISCKYTGVFPLPTVKLSWGMFELFEDHMQVNPLEDSYEVVIHKVLEHEELPAETVFGCELSIPGTPYMVREEAIYHHRGRREVERQQIRGLEARRKRKSKDQVSYNSITRLEAEDIKHIDFSSSSARLLPSLLLACLAWLSV
jgi:hypothetical protein